MALDCCQNFVSTQYLVKEKLEFDQILRIHRPFNRSRLGLLQSMFCLFTTELWPLIIIRILFSAQYLENKLME